MADSTTINYGWVQPEVGGSTDSWGDKLNATIAAIDSRAFANAQAAANALAAAQAAASVAGAALPAINYNANDVLAKLRTVHGEGSQLNADLVDNYHAASFFNSSNQNAGTLPVARLHGSILRNGYSSAVVTVSTAAPSGGNDGDIWLRIA